MWHKLPLYVLISFTNISYSLRRIHALPTNKHYCENWRESSLTLRQWEHRTSCAQDQWKRPDTRNLNQSNGTSLYSRGRDFFMARKPKGTQCVMWRRRPIALPDRSAPKWLPGQKSRSARVWSFNANNKMAALILSYQHACWGKKKLFKQLVFMFREHKLFSEQFMRIFKYRLFS